MTTGAIFSSSLNGYSGIIASLTAEEMKDKVLDRVVWELRFARADSVTLAQSTDSPSITFEKLQGWNVSAATYSEKQTISIYSGRVLLNGVAIADGVKKLTFNRSGSILTVAVEVEKSVGLGGNASLFTRHSSVKVTL